MQEHVVFSKESSFGSWMTPARAIPVTEAGIQSAREQIKAAVTGTGRGRWAAWQGAKPVAGPLNMPFWPVGVGTILSTFLADVAATSVAGGVYDQGMLPDDAAGHDGLSIQQIYSDAVALNILSAYVNTFTLTAAVKETAQIAFEMEAKDEALAEGTWDHDGSASPAIVSVPAYAALSLRPFIFYDATIVAGGTASLDDTENKIEIAAGTTYSQIENLEIGMAFNLDTDGFGLTTDPTRQSLVPGERVISAKFDIDWSELSTTFYSAWRAGSELALYAKFVGPLITGSYYYEGHIIIPALHFESVPLPPISGDKGRRKQSVAGEAVTEATTGYDVNVWLRTSEATL